MENSVSYFSIFRKKIFRNIFFSFMISLVLLIMMYGFFTFPMQKKSLIEVMHSQAKTLANSIALVCEDAMVNEDDSFIVEHNMAVLKDNLNIFSITVIKKDGMILKATKDGWETLETFEHDMHGHQKENEFFEIARDERQKQDVFHYTMAIIISGLDWGWIHIDFSLEQYNQNLKNSYLFIAYLTLGSLLVVLGVSFVLARYILKPILELTRASKEVAQGNLAAKAKIVRKDEIGEFAQDFNIMIEKLARSKEDLERSHEVLEARVKERTSALEEKSSELEALNKTLDHRVQEESQKSRKNEQLLIQQSRQAAMGEMIGNIAHQWRQPLNALGLVLQNIHFTYQMDELTEEFLQKSVEKGKMLTATMSKTIDDFRDFFKPNKLKEDFSVAGVIENTIGLIDASFKNSNIALTLDLDETCEINGYPSEFSQVILNILSNAKDALLEKDSQDKTVHISNRIVGDKAIIEISDTAGGIPEMIIEKIFDPYFTTKEEGKGTGIGLYMTKMIVENNMGGKLSVANVGAGAKFTIAFSLKKSEK